MTQDGHAAPDHTIVAAMEDVARQDPGRTAIVTAAGSHGYGDLLRAARRVAAWLAGQGVRAGETVGIAIRQEMPHVIGSLALLRLGCRQVTLASHDPPAQREALVARLGIGCVVAGAEDAVPAGPGVLRPDIAAIALDPALDAAPLPPPREGSLILTSSGTTGRPKLVELRESTLRLQGLVAAGLGRRRSRLVGCEFNNGKRLLLQTLGCGDTEVLFEETGWRRILEACHAHRVERINASPQKAAALLEEAAQPGFPAWPAHTALAVTGGPFPGPLRERMLAEVTGNLFILYGATETGGITLARPDEALLHPDTVGRPLPGVSLRIVDEAGQPLPAGERGFIQLRSAAAVEGYLDDAEATARCFRDGWYQSGDVGQLTPEGYLVFAGRGDDMMNLGSIKIFPAEIEAAAQGFPGLLDCAAFRLPSAALGDIPMLAVVPGPGFEAAALLAHCRARLGLRAPRRVVVMPSLPRNPQGKVLRQALSAMAKAGTP